MTRVGRVQYYKIAEIKGPLVIVGDVENAAFDELVEVETGEGERRLGKVMEMPVSKEVLGRVFDRLGRPKDNLPKIELTKVKDRYVEQHYQGRDE